MPGNILTVDTSFPQLTDKQTTDQKFRVITDYLYMLLEQLRYTLRNLGMGNFNDAELGSFVDYLKANLIEADTIISQTIIVNELYADYGSVADLTVDKLRTDYKRAQRYLQGDTSPLDYISIHDEEISFITAATDGTQTEQMEVDGLKFWWTDASKTQMTSREETKWPVIVYVYSEQVKGSFRFQPAVLADGTVTAMPVLVLGAGSGVGSNGRATIQKNAYGLDINYRTTGGVDTGVYCRDDGFTDVVQRRASIKIDSAQKIITVTPEGTLANSYFIGYTEDEGGGMTLTWPDGKTFTVEVD